MEKLARYIIRPLSPGENDLSAQGVQGHLSIQGCPKGEGL